MNVTIRIRGQSRLCFGGASFGIVRRRGDSTGLAVANGWFVGVITNNLESSLVDSTNHCFWWSRQSLVWAVSCRFFLGQKALLWAVLARAYAVYSSSLAMWVSVTPTCLPSQMARSFSDMSAEGCDPDLYSVQAELCSLLLRGAGSSLPSTIGQSHQTAA